MKEPGEGRAGREWFRWQWCCRFRKQETVNVLSRTFQTELARGSRWLITWTIRTGKCLQRPRLLQVRHRYDVTALWEDYCLWYGG